MTPPPPAGRLGDIERAYAKGLAAGVKRARLHRERLVAVATYAEVHRNMGLCPEGPADPSRDPGCRVCEWIGDAPVRRLRLSERLLLAVMQPPVRLSKNPRR